MNYNERSDVEIQNAANNLLNIFNNIRRECKVIPVQSGPVYLSEASLLCSIGTNASDVNEILTQQRIKDRLDKQDNMEKLMQYAIMLAVILAIPTGIWMLITNMA